MGLGMMLPKTPTKRVGIFNQGWLRHSTRLEPASSPPHAVRGRIHRPGHRPLSRGSNPETPSRHQKSPNKRTLTRRPWAWPADSRPFRSATSLISHTIQNSGEQYGFKNYTVIQKNSPAMTPSRVTPPCAIEITKETRQGGLFMFENHLFSELLGGYSSNAGP